jgi:hypothetical protein
VKRAVHDTKQMDVIRYRDGMESTLDIEFVYRLREFVIGGAEVNALAPIGCAVLPDKFGIGAAARETDVFKQRLLRACDVPHFVEGHAEFIVRAAIFDMQVAGAHAHYVREHGDDDQEAQWQKTDGFPERSEILPLPNGHGSVTTSETSAVWRVFSNRR